MAVSAKRTKYLIAAAGALGFLLRMLLYTAGRDTSGLLVRGHWAGIALLVLTCGVLFGLPFLTRSFQKSESRFAFPPASLTGAAGATAAALAFFLCPSPDAPNPFLTLLETVLRFGSGLALLAVGFCRFRGRKPGFLLHCTVCLYLAVRLVCQYRLWSSDPQLQDYCYYLGAQISLMLTGYQFAALDAGIGSHRKLWNVGLTSVYLCAVSLWGEGEPLLMACCGIWVLTNLSHFTTKEQERYV